MHAVASISQSALAHNLLLAKQLSATSQVVSMVKADAYGHHLDLVAPLIAQSDLLAVSQLAEAKKLRQQTKKPILLLPGVYSPQQLKEAIALNCHVVVHQPQQIDLINNGKKMLNVWIKLDTGMNRLGLSATEYNACLKTLQNNPLINIACVMSHFACADKPEHAMNTTQLQDFTQLTHQTDKRSMANSAAILTQPKALFDFVRPGIMLYGVSPFAEIDNRLKPVMQLHASIVSSKVLQAGDSVGYGADWTATQKTTLAVVAIGYGDGYPRHAKNGTPVLVNNTLCPLVGRVSMDLICVDVSQTNARIGDKVILWGNEQLRVETIAQHSDTIAYELLTGLSNRVEFKQVP